ncbi:MAG: tetratricopeptide repeat protein [Parvularculaceae bacterium]|nr:tetratricopeptide repeat protein [Parvularculaceae bacterium]
MISRDRFGLPITNASTGAAAGYDAYVREFLSYGSKLRDLFAVADGSPDAALLSAHAAALHLAFEGAEGWAHARPFLERMRANAGQASEREQMFCAAVEAWADRDYWRAQDLLDTLTVRWPADLCAIKWGQYHAFNLGDAAALLRFGERARIVFENEPYANGLLAFALEQNHQLEEAEDAGLYATELAIDDAWAHHAVAHVMETQGRARDGARWLDHCAHTWEKKGVFIRDHNWWHAGLFQIALGREDLALKIYDDRLWGAWPEFPQEQIGAVSMLWRLEMRGVDVGARWEPVIAQVRRRAGEHILPFHDLHYLYALARAGEVGEACAFMASLKAHAEAATDRCRDFWRGVGIPAAEGVLAFAQNDCERAAGSLARALPDLHLAGGSHAQRGVFIEAFERASAGDTRGKMRAL